MRTVAVAQAGDLINAIGQRIRAGSPIELCGLEAYEGAVPGTGAAWRDGIEAYFDVVRSVYAALVASDLLGDAHPPILSVGWVGDLRPGCPGVRSGVASILATSRNLAAARRRAGL